MIFVIVIFSSSSFVISLMPVKGGLSIQCPYQLLSRYSFFIWPSVPQKPEELHRTLGTSSNHYRFNSILNLLNIVNVLSICFLSAQIFQVLASLAIINVINFQSYSIFQVLASCRQCLSISLL